MNRATDIAEAVRNGKMLALDAVEQSIERIRRSESQVQAFAAFNAEAVRDEARRVDLQSTEMPLAGVSLGVKDVFDTADYPTEYYSPIYEGHRPQADAWAVARLREAGCIVMGKAHTAEFAYMATGPTRNPHDLRRTPGSSSAGSAAGVAAGFFDIAIGTQTAGSVIKPASYCGIFAMKPSYGRVPLRGVKLLAPSFDTVGWFARHVSDLEAVAAELIGDLEPRPLVKQSLRLGYVQPFGKVATSVRRAYASAISRLEEAGHITESLTLSSDIIGIGEDHRIINDAEGAISLAGEAQSAIELLSDEVLEMLRRAAQTSAMEVSRARARIRALTPKIVDLTARYDAMLSPSCGILAPIGLKTTGPSDLIKIWMAFGLPQINIPLTDRRSGLHVGLQLIGAPNGDRTLLISAHQIWEVINASADLGNVPHN